jgi:hypothetical protein
MTLIEIQARVRDVCDSRGDDERAHALEDSLHQDVLRAIALCDLDCDPSVAASAALATTAIDFARYCA